MHKKKSSENTKCWWGWEKLNHSYMLVGMYNGVAMLESWQFLKKLIMQLPYDPEIVLLGIYPREMKTYIDTKTCTQMFIAALFITAKTGSNSYILEWTNKLWTLHVMEHYLAMKRTKYWASLVAQWLRICLPMQGTRVRALVWEDATCRGATRPVSHNCWACASGACAPQQERPR